MNSNMANTINNSSQQNESNIQKNIINPNFINQYEVKEKDELKNLRIESSLSLRKKKLNQLIFSKRIKQIYDQNNNDDDDENNLYINYENTIKKIPYLFTSEFDLYEDKISVIHQILNKDFTILHGLEYDEKSLFLFVIYKLTELTYKNKEFYEGSSEKNIKIIFYDVIKLLNENNKKKIIFTTTIILMNCLCCSEIITKEFKKVNIWKRLAEITELKIPHINDNVVNILLNYYHSDQNIGKEYIISNYSRYIKQILTNFFKSFIEESKNEKIELNLFISGIILIKKLINNTPQIKKTKDLDDLDVVVKFKFIYDYLTKSFLIASSWIINNCKYPKHEHIFDFVLNLIDLFNSIITYSDEETYQMQEFRGESFASSFCSLLKYLILDKEKAIPRETILDIISELYHFIGILFSVEHDKTEIYSQNKILDITGEFIQNINSMKVELVKKIIFFLSNYSDSENRVKEIFEESNIAIIIKNYIYNNIFDNDLCYNSFYLIENGFEMGENNNKELIIKDFSNFLIERLKILYNLIISNETKDPGKYTNHFICKCTLLTNIIVFLRKKTNNLQLLKDLLDYIKISNIEEFIINMKINIKDEKDIELIESLLKEIKN